MAGNFDVTQITKVVRSIPRDFEEGAGSRNPQSFCEAASRGFERTTDAWSDLTAFENGAFRADQIQPPLQHFGRVPGKALVDVF
jgi:hypothetical protein